MHMPLLQAILMGIIQGLAEFAPISSSAHLVLFPWLFHPLVSGQGWIEDPGQAFDAALHIGTAFALIVYFWSTWKEILSAWWISLWDRQGGVDSTDKNSQPGDRPPLPPRHSWDRSHARMGWLIIIASIPGALFGKLWEKKFETLFDPVQHPWAPAAIGALLAVMGIVLWLADHFGKNERSLQRLNRGDAALVGLSQVLALFPGVSRSGATITAGRALGLKRETAARFSFLIATPITLGAGLLKVVELRHSTNPHPQLSAILVGIITSGVVGYMVIKWLLSYLQRQNLNAFVAYRIIVGLAVIAVWFARR